MGIDRRKLEFARVRMNTEPETELDVPLFYLDKAEKLSALVMEDWRKALQFFEADPDFLDSELSARIRNMLEISFGLSEKGEKLTDSAGAGAVFRDYLILCCADKGIFRLSHEDGIPGNHLSRLFAIQAAIAPVLDRVDRRLFAVVIGMKARGG